MRELLARVPAADARSLRYFGLPESEIAATLRDIAAQRDLSGVEITTCLRRSELEVDLRPQPGAGSAAEELHAELAARHARHLVSVDGTSTDELLAGALRERGWTVATGESCTGGMLAARLVDLAGSSDYVAGGVAAYSNTAKTALLGVPPELIAAHGAVSPEVARALADGARERFGADLGIGITGVAGPGGGTEAKPVGYVCFCVTTADGQVLARDPASRAAAPTSGNAPRTWGCTCFSGPRAIPDSDERRVRRNLSDERAVRRNAQALAASKRASASAQFTTFHQALT